MMAMVKKAMPVMFIIKMESMSVKQHMQRTVI